MANNYPYKIVRTGDQVETLQNLFHTIQFVVVGGKRVFETTMENLEGVIVEVDGMTKYVQRELIRKIHTTEIKKCRTKAVTTS